MKDNFECSSYHSPNPNGDKGCPNCGNPAPSPFDERFYAGRCFALGALAVSLPITLIFLLGLAPRLTVFEVFALTPAAVAGVLGEIVGRMIVADISITRKQAGLLGFFVSFGSLVGFCMAWAASFGWGDTVRFFIICFIGACIVVGWLIFPIGVLLGLWVWDNAKRIRPRPN